jgi:hypothetical protein
MILRGERLTVNPGDERDKLSQEVTICRNGEPEDVVPAKSTRQSGPKFATMKNRILVKDPEWHSGPERI